MVSLYEYFFSNPTRYWKFDVRSSKANYTYSKTASHLKEKRHLILETNIQKAEDILGMTTDFTWHLISKSLCDQITYK
jgi:hypothetical protein